MIKLLLMSKNQKTSNGVKFRKFWTSVNIVVAGEEEKGKQKKSLTVRFDKAVDTSKLSRGILTLNDTDIDMPYKWQIRQVEKNGVIKEQYPSCYIKAYQNFEPRKPKTTATFDLLDEEETEDVEIIEDNEQ